MAVAGQLRRRRALLVMTIPQNLPRRGLNRRQQRVERKREQWRRQMDQQPGVAIPYPQQSRLSRNTRQSYQSRIGTWFGAGYHAAVRQGQLLGWREP